VPEVSAKELEEVNNSLDELEALIILNSHKKVDVQVPQNVQETVVQVAPEEVKVVKEKEEKPDRMPLFLRILLWTLASIVFLIIFLAIVLSVYVIVTQFVTNNFTDSIDTFVNKLTFGDKGLIDILRDAFARIGIYKAN
ncbi:MAG: hypothetical protein LBV51_03345, partial [Acholeplasmatales bacterium]|nr:hypothetical protein [Acholeplasmatales bacterium]